MVTVVTKFDYVDYKKSMRNAKQYRKKVVHPTNRRWEHRRIFILFSIEKDEVIRLKSGFGSAM